MTNARRCVPCLVMVLSLSVALGGTPAALAAQSPPARPPPDARPISSTLAATPSPHPVDPPRDGVRACGPGGCAPPGRSWASSGKGAGSSAECAREWVVSVAFDVVWDVGSDVVSVPQQEGAQHPAPSAARAYRSRTACVTCAFVCVAMVCSLV